MLSYYNNNDMHRFHVGCNKRPRWDEAAGGHTLNFRGRVTEKSVKNFQLKCNDLSGEDTVLQFGRVDKNRFTMDFGYPLSPLQAFAICLASLDGKVSDSSAINGMKKGVRRMSSFFRSKKTKTKQGKSGGSEDDEEKREIIESGDDEQLDNEVLVTEEERVARTGTGETKTSAEPILKGVIRASAVKKLSNGNTNEDQSGVLSVVTVEDFPLRTEEDMEQVPVRPPRSSLNKK